MYANKRKTIIQHVIGISKKKKNENQARGYAFQEHGVPCTERSGVIRWKIFLLGKIIFPPPFQTLSFGGIVDRILFSIMTVSPHIRLLFIYFTP